MSQIVFNTPISEPSLQSQIENFQTTLASLNQQVIILQETLQEREKEIAELKGSQNTSVDETLTIVGGLINLYKFIFLPKENS